MLLPLPVADTIEIPAKPTMVYCVLLPLPEYDENSGMIRGCPAMPARLDTSVLLSPGPPLSVAGWLGVACKPVTLEVCWKVAVAVAVQLQLLIPSTLAKNRGTGVLAVLSRRNRTWMVLGMGWPTDLADSVCCWFVGLAM